LPVPSLFPYTTLFRSIGAIAALTAATIWGEFSSHTATSLLVLDVTVGVVACALLPVLLRWPVPGALALAALAAVSPAATPAATRSEEHTSELQSRGHL